MPFEIFPKTRYFLLWFVGIFLKLDKAVQYNEEGFAQICFVLSRIIKYLLVSTDMLSAVVTPSGSFGTSWRITCEVYWCCL